MGAREPRGMNWDQLRHRIDAGETGDKVPGSDPAIAPLGTDEEAGGASTSPEDIAASALQQAVSDAGDAPPLARAAIVFGVAAALAIVLALLLVWASSTGA